MTGSFDDHTQGSVDQDDLPPADPATALRLIREQQTEAARRLNPNRLYYYVPWGLAWLIGFGLFFLRFGPDGRVFVRLPTWLPLTALLVLLAAAALISGIASVRAYSQVAGDSSRRGAWYGLAWVLGILGLSMTLGRVTEHLPNEQAGLLWAGAMVGLTGTLHLAGGAVWLDWNLFTLGVWINVINIVGLIAGPGWHALVIALAGGGGMLLAGVFWVRNRPRSVR